MTFPLGLVSRQGKEDQLYDNKAGSTSFLLLHSVSSVKRERGMYFTQGTQFSLRLPHPSAQEGKDHC